MSVAISPMDSLLSVYEEDLEKRSRDESEQRQQDGVWPAAQSNVDGLKGHLGRGKKGE